MNGFDFRGNLGQRSRLGRRSLLQALGVAAVGISFGGLAACGKSEGGAVSANGEEAKLNFYNWDTYIGETTLDDFKEASGIDVNMSLFATNDELFAKLRAGNPGYRRDRTVERLRGTHGPVGHASSRSITRRSRT